MEINGIILTNNGNLSVPNRINKKLIEKHSNSKIDKSAKASFNGLMNYKKMVQSQNKYTENPESTYTDQ